MIKFTHFLFEYLKKNRKNILFIATCGIIICIVFLAILPSSSNTPIVTRVGNSFGNIFPSESFPRFFSTPSDPSNTDETSIQEPAINHQFDFITEALFGKHEALYTNGFAYDITKNTSIDLFKTSIKNTTFDSVSLIVNPANLENPDYMNYLISHFMIAKDEKKGITLSYFPSEQVRIGLSEAQNITKYTQLVSSSLKTISSKFKDQFRVDPLVQPIFENQEQWKQFYDRIIPSIKEIIANSTIIAEINMIFENQWDGFKALQNTTPLSYQNVIYGFEFFEPGIFSHQGASWVWESLTPLNNIPYPSSPELCGQVLNEYQGESESIVRYYCEQEWNKQNLSSYFKTLSEWEAKHDQTIVISSYGIATSKASQESSKNYYNDISALFDEFGFERTRIEPR
jgi:hypothetical protein